MEKISGNLEGVTFVELEKLLNLQDPFSSDSKAKISDAYRIFAELVQDRKLNKVFKKPARVSPVEFTTIGLLVFVHKDTLTMAQLSDGIAKMRDDVRATYVDIWMDSGVIKKTMIDFIKSLRMPKFPGDTGGPASATGNTAGLRRKRTVQRHESEDEEDNEETDGQSPKVKKKCATESNMKPSSSRIGSSPSEAAVPSKVKAEPVASSVVPSQAPKPAPSDRKSLEVPKIPGDTGGPAGVSGSTAGLKRKRTERQYESEDEEDKDDNEGRNPKAKKKSTVSYVKPLGSPRICSSPSEAAVPLTVKAEPVTSSVIPSEAPIPLKVKVEPVASSVPSQAPIPLEVKAAGSIVCCSFANI